MGIVQGSGVDSSLNQTGWQQSQAFFDKYHPVNFEIVITSVLKRTQETMKPFIEQGIPWERYDWINEMSWGYHEGKHRDANMRAEHQFMMDEWSKGNFDAKIPDGESANEMAARVLNFIEHLKERQEQNILVCAHGRVMRCILCLMMQQPLFHMEEYKHYNTGLYQLTLHNELFEIQIRNDISHLNSLAI